MVVENCGIGSARHFISFQKLNSNNSLIRNQARTMALNSNSLAALLFCYGRQHVACKNRPERRRLRCGFSEKDNHDEWIIVIMVIYSSDYIAIIFVADLWTTGLKGFCKPQHILGTWGDRLKTWYLQSRVAVVIFQGSKEHANLIQSGTDCPQNMPWCPHWYANHQKPVWAFLQALLRMFHRGNDRLAKRNSPHWRLWQPNKAHGVTFSHHSLAAQWWCKLASPCQ